MRRTERQGPGHAGLGQEYSDSLLRVPGSYGRVGAVERRIRIVCFSDARSVLPGGFAAYDLPSGWIPGDSLPPLSVTLTTYIVLNYVFLPPGECV